MILLTDKALEPELVTEAVRAPTNGGVVTFLGVTRDNTGGRSTRYLEYEAYEPMAEAKLAEIAAEIREEWPVEDVAIAHRLGRLEIGDVSLIVAVGSPHREAAFRACAQVVDRIKQTVPIWKKEHFVDGEVWVESPEFFESRGAGATPGG